MALWTNNVARYASDGTDLSGNGNDLTLVGGTSTLVAGMAGTTNAARLMGTGAEYTINDNASVSLTTGFTIAGKFKFVAADVNRSCHLIAKIAVGSYEYGLIKGDDEKIYIFISADGSTVNVYQATNSTVTTDRWYRIRIHYDGEHCWTVIDSQTDLGSVKDYALDVYNGTAKLQFAERELDTGNRFDGAWQDIAIWNVSKSDADMAEFDALGDNFEVLDQTVSGFALSAASELTDLPVRLKLYQHPGVSLADSRYLMDDCINFPYDIRFGDGVDTYKQFYQEFQKGERAPYFDSRPFLSHWGYPAMYDSVLDRTYVGFFERVSNCQYITYYDHTTGAWGMPYELYRHTDPDTHNCPTVWVNATGYVYVLYRGDSNVIYLKKTTSAGSIHAWTSKTAPAPNGTGYHHLYEYGGELFCFFQGSLWQHIWTKSSDDGSTWSSQTTWKTISSGNFVTYAQDPFFDATNGHLHFAWGEQGGSVPGGDPSNYWGQRNAYYVEFRMGDGHFYTAGGTDCGTDIDAELSSCKVYDSSFVDSPLSNNTLHHRVVEDNGKLIMVWLQNTKGYPAWKLAPLSIYQSVYSGGSWTTTDFQTPVLIDTDANMTGKVSLVHRGTDDVRMYVNEPGHELVEYKTTNQATSWTKTDTLCRTQQSEFGRNFYGVHNANAECIGFINHYYGASEEMQGLWAIGSLMKKGFIRMDVQVPTIPVGPSQAAMVIGVGGGESLYEDSTLYGVHLDMTSDPGLTLDVSQHGEGSGYASYYIDGLTFPDKYALAVGLHFPWTVLSTEYLTIGGTQQSPSWYKDILMKLTTNASAPYIDVQGVGSDTTAQVLIDVAGDYTSHTPAAGHRHGGLFELQKLGTGAGECSLHINYEESDTFQAASATTPDEFRIAMVDSDYETAGWDDEYQAIAVYMYEGTDYEVRMLIEKITVRQITDVALTWHETLVPVVEITAPADGSTTNDSTPLLTYTVTPPSGNTITVEVDGQVVTPTPDGVNDPLPALSEGPHTVEVTAENAYGGTGSTTSNFTVDLTAPAVTMNSWPSAVTITGTCEANAVIDVNPTAPATAGLVTYPSSTTWQCTVSGVNESSTAVSISAEDAAGNIRTISKTLGFGSGSGGGIDRAVDHHTGADGLPSADFLRVVTSGSTPISGVEVRAFLTEDYAAGNTGLSFVIGRSETGADGRWSWPINLDPGISYTISFRKHGSYQETSQVVDLSAFGAPSGVSEGTGDTEVDHDTGGTDALRALDKWGSPLDNVQIKAYLTSDWSAGNRSEAYVAARSYTNADGRWGVPVNLDAGYDYTIAFYRQGDYQPTTSTVGL